MAKSKRKGRKTQHNPPAPMGDEPWRSNGDLFRWAVFRVVDGTAKIFSPRHAIWGALTVLVLVAAFLLYISLLPSQERVKALPVMKDALVIITDHLASQFVVYLGWFLFVGCLLTLIASSTILIHRLHKQGKELAECRNNSNPGRLSSSNETTLLNHDNVSKIRFPANDAHSDS